MRDDRRRQADSLHGDHTLLTVNKSMCAKLFFSRLSAALRAFRRADRGNVAMALGLAIVPAVGMTGAAIDYSRTNSVKAGMQTALASPAPHSFVSLSPCSQRHE